MPRRITRAVPGTHWVQVWWSRNAQPGNGWLHSGAVFRICIPVPLTRWQIGLLVMPNHQNPARFTGARKTAHRSTYPEPAGPPTNIDEVTAR